jgi:peptide/nickel transport system substrate-binding protein
MKKLLLTSLIFVLVSGYALYNGVQTVMAAEEKAKYGGILNYNLSKPADVIGDPTLIMRWNHYYIDFMLQTLVIPSNDKPGSFEPELATSWELAPDRSYYIFNLRKGVKFHDGTDWNAQSAKWNLDRWLQGKRPKFDKLKSVEVIDDYTIKCNLSGWDAVTLFDFGKDSYNISPTAFEKNGQEWAKYNPIGTGAFKLVEYKRDISLTFEKVKDYWVKGLPYLDGIHVSQIKDPMTAIASLKRGETDAWMNIDSVSGAELKATGNFIIDTNPGTNDLLNFNSKDPNSLWSNKKLRMALEYSIDKVAIAKATGRGFKLPVYEIVHSIPAKAGTVPRKYDPDKARQLLNEAGFPKDVKIKLTYAALPQFQDVVVAIQQYLSEVGIQVVPNPLAGAAYSEKIMEPPQPDELLMDNQRGGPNELLYAVKETLAPGSVYFPGVKRPDGFDDLLAKAMGTEKLDETMDNLYKMEKLAYDDAMFVPLNNQLFISVQNPYVKGAIWFWGKMPYAKLHYCWLDK